jgi:putative transposase
VLDELVQSIHDRADAVGQNHRGDRESQDLLVRYSEDLAECGVGASAGTACDSYDNELAGDNGS